MTLAPFVRIVAQGKGRARSLTLAEATEAMSVILSGKAAPEAIGGLLMVLRLRGETDEEIAGFTASLRQFVQTDLPKADLDWPCYAAGRTRGAPLFLLAAKLVTHAGFCVSMHGVNTAPKSGVDVSAAYRGLGFEGSALQFAPLADLSPGALSLLKLRSVLGLRSCVNTVLRMWNPSGAGASVQGVFHPSYRGLQSRAASLLGDTNLTVIKGGGGEFERNPSKDIALFGLRDGVDLNAQAPALIPEAQRLHDPDHPVDLAAMWQGQTDDPFAVATITGTAALALWTVKARPTVADCQTLAQQLWADRHSFTGETP